MWDNATPKKEEACILSFSVPHQPPWDWDWDWDWGSEDEERLMWPAGLVDLTLLGRGGAARGVAGRGGAVSVPANLTRRGPANCVTTA